jgi:RNA polymerase sigma-70 factor (ECF subfamily)
VDDTVARKKFGLMYDQHRRAILAYCMRRAGKQDALEAMNETFTIAWRRIERAPDPAEALPWLYTKARGVLSNQRRGRRRFRPADQQDRIAGRHPGSWTRNPGGATSGVS